MDQHEAICRAMFAAQFGEAYGGPDAPFSPFWCDPNGCGSKAHAHHADTLAWFTCDDEAKTFVRKLGELGYCVQAIGLAGADAAEGNGLSRASGET